LVDIKWDEPFAEEGKDRGGHHVRNRKTDLDLFQEKPVGSPSSLMPLAKTQTKGQWEECEPKYLLPLGWSPSIQNLRNRILETSHDIEKFSFAKRGGISQKRGLTRL